MHPICHYIHELNKFSSRFKGSLKVPMDYGASLLNDVVDKKLKSMKTQYYHLLMQQLLPLCLYGSGTTIMNDQNMTNR
jgi:hypothetical protein